MLIIFSVFDRINLLPYFLRFYSSRGATQFVCALYNGELNPFYNQILSFKRYYNLIIRTSLSCKIEEYSPQGEMLGLNRIRVEFASEFDWYCIADLDEFYYCGNRTFFEMVREAELNGFNAVHGVYFDRIAIDGNFSEIRDKSLDDTFPLVCNLTFCCGAACNKIAFAKSHIRIECGHHFAEAKVWPNVVQVHHFKWQKGIYEIIEDRWRRYEQLKLAMADRELPSMLRLIKRNGVDMNNPKLKIRQSSRLGI